VKEGVRAASLIFLEKGKVTVGRGKLLWEHIKNM